MIFSGLSAFPLTPIHQGKFDEAAYIKILERLVNSGVDSIGALGSTGCYTYLTRAERKRVIELTVKYAAGTAIIAGISGQCTRDVLEFAEDVQQAGVAAVLLSATSYQALSQDEVFSLYQEATANLSVPLCIYDNPGTTHFTFTEQFYTELSQLPNVCSIKIPGVPANLDTAKAKIRRLKSSLPEHVSLGVSGDGFGAMGLNAGCDLWYSAIAGTFPKTMLAITRAAQAGDSAKADDLSASLQPLWDLFAKYGSLRVIAAAAELQNLVSSPCLPKPLIAIQGEDRKQLSEWISEGRLG